jgi:DNA repair photolyase
MREAGKRRKYTMIIYEPTGKAKEYAELACNIYNGCTHGCKYCYAKRYKQEQYYVDADPKKDVIAKLCKDVAKLDPATTPEILLSFQGDVYQHAETKLGLTRQALEIMVENDLPFTVLTKGGLRAVRDFDLLEQSGKARFGTSLVWMHDELRQQHEPDAASVFERIQVIREAKLRGIPTWVSLEPVIDPCEALAVIWALHDVVDFWKVGKINHNKELEQAQDWVKFRDNVTELLEKFGAKYYIKNSLTKLQPI